MQGLGSPKVTCVSHGDESRPHVGEAIPAGETSHRFVRVGTWLWEPPEGLEVDAVTRQVVQALERDTRVLKVRRPVLNDHWVERIRFFPDAPRTSPEKLVTGVDSFRALQLSDCVTFTVRVPIKNQTTHGGFDDVPSDTYFVAWDGISVFVLWEQADVLAPMSGGHVVEDVLREALTATGSHLYVQNCSPGCSFMFIHRPLRLLEAPDVHQFKLHPATESAIRMYIPSFDHDPLEDVDYVAVMLRGSVQEFAEYKNLGRRLIDLEDEVRGDLAHVLHHFHAHAQLVALGFSKKALKERWRARKWRTEARSLVARIWLVMANIETLRRQWEHARTGLSGQPDSLLLFDTDYANDAESVTSLQLEPVAETVNQVAVGLDNRMVVAATGWGAVAGGVAGGLTGLLG